MGFAASPLPSCGAGHPGGKSRPQAVCFLFRVNTRILENNNTEDG